MPGVRILPKKWLSKKRFRICSGLREIHISLAQKGWFSPIFPEFWSFMLFLEVVCAEMKESLEVWWEAPKSTQIGRHRVYHGSKLAIWGSDTLQHQWKCEIQRESGSGGVPVRKLLFWSSGRTCSYSNHRYSNNGRNVMVVWFPVVRFSTLTICSSGLDEYITV